jgi:Tol biopolymer transport system component/C-terminal processing protease CtpA/Prc
MSRLASLLAASALLLGTVPTNGQQPPAASQPLAAFAEPAISPDRQEIAFVSGGDIWTVNAGGGEGRLLVSHSANESRPIYSPDGRTLAFISDRTGGGDIYLLTLASGALRQLTFDEGNDRLDGWSRDGRWVYFSSSSRDISGMNDIFRVSADGGTPMAVSADRYTSEFFAAPAPEGQRLAFSARGNSLQQWWRKGHSHLDESELWLLHDGPTPRYEKLTERGAKQMWPMWMPDGKSLYFVSDRSGAQNLWIVTPGGAPRQVSRFDDGRVLWPTISYDGRTIVFERDFEIWKLETADGRAARVPITKRGAPAAPSLEHVTLNNGFSDLALSPDGRKVVFVARGEVWAAPARDGGDAVRVTRSLGRESQLAWTPDSRRIVYASERTGVSQLYLYDFPTSTETQLTSSAVADQAPALSPDGKTLAFVRDGKELHVLDLAAKTDKVVAKGYLTRSSRGIAWSPDNKWIAYIGVRAPSFRNVFAVPVTGGESRPVTAMPNGNANNLSWSPDGTYLVFNTNQRTEPGEAVRVDLVLKTPRFREDRFRDLFKEEPARTPPAPRVADPPADQPAAPRTATAVTPPNVDIVFDDVRRRLSILPVGVDVTSQVISSDGRTLLLTAAAEGQTNLYTYSLDELAREPAVARQLTSTPGAKADAQFTADGREVFYLEQGRIHIIPLETRTARAVAVTAEMDVDFAQEKLEVFRQAWTYMRDGFYDDKFHGVDWDAVRRQYAPRIAGAQTPDEMRRLLNMMVGELNASHMGVAAGPAGRATVPTAGRLGLRFDRAEFETNGRLKVSEVIALGPAAVSKAVSVGDYIVAIDGTAIGPRTNLDELLMHGVNQRVAVRVSKTGNAADGKDTLMQPITSSAEKNLLYGDWIESNRRYVEKISGGRLGYAHMNDMSEGALRRLYMDLDADTRQKDGVVIDVRNNNGGFVNVYAIDVLARRGYMNMTPRGLPMAAARTMLGQRALERPTILVTNQHSLSDAEDFTEGYRTLKLGKVVGEPTSGWIIYTGSQTLVDGSTIRMPGTRITTLDGLTMELNPRPVDIPVTRPIGESLQGKDTQLDAAVRELLLQLRPATTTQGARR